MGTTIEIEVGNLRYSLPKLTVAEFINLSDRARDRDRKRVLSDLETAGADPELTIRTLQEHAERSGSGLSVFHYITSYEGAFDVLQTSCKRLNGSAPDLNALNPVKVLEWACALCNIDVGDREPETDESEED